MGNIDEVRGGKLKTMRESARLTQRQVGDHFGIDKASVSAWERGLGKPTLDKLKSLDSLYGGGGGVLALFDVSSPKKPDDNTGELLRLTAIVDRLEQRVAALESRAESPKRRASR